MTESKQTQVNNQESGSIERIVYQALKLLQRTFVRSLIEKIAKTISNVLGGYVCESNNSSRRSRKPQLISKSTVHTFVGL